jgi:Domain of unknown function (DUF222)
MSESVETDVSVLDVLAGLERFEDELAAMPLELCSDSEIVEVLRRREISRRKAAVLDQRLIEQVHRRSIFFAKGCATVVVFLRMLLRITPVEAAARFRAARLLGPQRNVQGEPTALVFPKVSAAQGAGEISAAHAAVVVDMISKLPHEVAAVMDRTVETLLVGFAREHDPLELRHHAQDLRNYLDQDGQYKDAAYRDRIRDARLRDNADGSGRLEGELTGECAERFRVMFDTLAKPRPAEDGTPTPAHRVSAAMMRCSNGCGWSNTPGCSRRPAVSPPP